jgi:hypothetical protein
MTPANPKYEVSLSFAGEQREYVEVGSQSRLTVRGLLLPLRKTSRYQGRKPPVPQSRVSPRNRPRRGTYIIYFYELRASARDQACRPRTT